MISMLTRKKRFIVIITILLLVIFGILLTYLMHRYVGEIAPVYYGWEGVYGIPYNIGFRASTLCGVAALVLFQVALYITTGCDYEFFIETMISGVWLADAIIIPEISSNSRIFFFLRLRDDIGFDMGYDFFRTWNYIEIGIYMVIVAIVLWYLDKLICGNDRIDDEKTRHTVRVFRLLMTAIGVVLLLVRSYTNIWYVLLCLIAFVISGVVLKRIEASWNMFIWEEDDEQT